MIFFPYYDILIVGCKSMKRNKKVFSFLDVSIIVGITAGIMCFLGAIIIYKHLGGVNFAMLGEDANLKEFIGAYNNLIDNYYDTLDSKKLIDGAIGGMYEVVGDPYTTYLDSNSSNSLDSSLNGRYEGIGVGIRANEEGHIVIREVYDDSPASKAGLQPGDIITLVDDEDPKGDASLVTKKLQEKKSAKFTILRDGQTFEVTLKSSTLLTPVVTSHIFDQNEKRVGYLRLTVFSDTADIQFSNALNKLERQGIDSLVIDLRDNSGGYLQVAKNIAEMFIEKGKIIYSLEGKDIHETTKDETSEKRNYPVSVLINRHSASASEILAAALKYSYGAKLTGLKSYGKGKVQERASLSGGTTVKYTTAEWLTPNGDCIDGIGLTPDLEIEFLAEGFDQDDLYTDYQIMQTVKDLAE